MPEKNTINNKVERGPSPICRVDIVTNDFDATLSSGVSLLFRVPNDIGPPTPLLYSSSSIFHNNTSTFGTGHQIVASVLRT